MGSIMTVRAPEDLQDILSEQAKSLGLAKECPDPADSVGLGREPAAAGDRTGQSADSQSTS